MNPFVNYHQHGVQLPVGCKDLFDLTWLAVIAALLILAVLVTTVGRTPQPTSRSLPNPNGYDDFLQAAAALTGDIGNSSTLDRAGLQALVSTNAEALRSVRQGLSRKCSVPTDSAMTNVPGMLADLPRLKSLARLFTEEGRLAEMENRDGDAAHSYLDTIRFGNEMSRGGFMITRLVGVACEAIGQTPLSKLVPRLSPVEGRWVIGELEKIDRNQVKWEETRQNESRFERYQLGKGFNMITWVATRWNAWRSRQRAEMRDRRILAHLRLLTVELALRGYQSEQGRVPTGLEELVPKYLERVPADPFRARPLVYRPQGVNWLLYSVGEDCVDDGGKPVGRSGPGTVTKGDIFFDSPY